MEPIGGDVCTQNNSDPHIPPTTVKCILIGDKQVGKTSLVVSYISNDYPSEYKPSVLDAFCVEVCAESRPVQLQICDAGGKAELHSLRQISYPGTHVILLCFSVVRPDSFRSLKTNWLNELANSSILLNPVAQLTAARLLNKSRSTTKVSNSSSSSMNPFRVSSNSSKLKPILNNSRSINPNHQCHNNKHNNNPKYTSRTPGPTFLLIGCCCDLRNDITCLLELSQMGEEPVDKETAELLASELGAEAYVECSALTQKNLKTVFDLAIWFGLRVADAGGPADQTRLTSTGADINCDNVQNFGPNVNTSFSSSVASLNCSSVCPLRPYSNNYINQVGTNGLCDIPLHSKKHQSSSSTSLTTKIGKLPTSNRINGNTKKGWKKYLCMV